jgi:hypothetical protein
LLLTTEQRQFVPGRDPERIQLAEIFAAVRALHGGRLPIALHHLKEPAALLTEIESAVRDSLRSRSLKDLLGGGA